MNSGPRPRPPEAKPGYATERGAALVIALMFLSILAMLGTTAVILTGTDLKIGGNYKTGVTGFYAAQAGLEEARLRLNQSLAVPPRIPDNFPVNTQWRAFIGTFIGSWKKGYQALNSMHVKAASLETDPDLEYTVKIAHLTQLVGGVEIIVYWGDTDGDGICEQTTVPGPDMRNIYRTTSYGAFGNAEQAVVADMAPRPPFTAPAALYVNASTTIQGASTNIIGLNPAGCGTGPDLPAIASTLASGSVTINGNPAITGVNGDDDIVYNTTPLDIQVMVDGLKNSPDYKYTVSSATHTGMNWGTPTPGATLQDPSSCNDHNVVYYDTGGTDIQLTGGCSGCGVLLIEGDLDINGNFSWHGPVLVTGSVTFTGGGNKNITGALLSGGSVDADMVGGNANIVYCGDAIDQGAFLSLVLLNWKEELRLIP